VGCVPISGTWAIAKGNYKCVNTRALYTAGSVTDIVTDSELYLYSSIQELLLTLEVAILALPVYNVWKLQMPKARKLAVIGIFLLGTLVIITGIVRLAYVIEAFHALETEATADGTCKSMQFRLH
jgi:hypothetical protein